MKGELTKDEIREMIREQDKAQAARMSEEEIEEMVDRLHAEQESLFREHVTGLVNQELMRMAARGEVYWDPEVEAWKMAP